MDSLTKLYEFLTVLGNKDKFKIDVNMYNLNNNHFIYNV